MTAVEEAQKYLKEHRINDVFKFLISHLMVKRPENPVEYLDELLEKCILFRSNLDAEAPLLFTSRHTESIFQSLDSTNIGSITLEQYRMGMKTLGVYRYDPNPLECSSGRVDKPTFQEEANRCLIEILTQLLSSVTSK